MVAGVAYTKFVHVGLNLEWKLPTPTTPRTAQATLAWAATGEANRLNLSPQCAPLPQVRTAYGRHRRQFPLLPDLITIVKSKKSKETAGLAEWEWDIVVVMKLWN